MARIVPEGGWEQRLKPFKTPRVEVRKHLDFIKSLPCVCCTHPDGAGSMSTGFFAIMDPGHIRAGSRMHGKEPAGGAQTSDDRWALPLCRIHHDRQHSENELEFWQRHGIDPFLLALVLWGLTGNEFAARQVIKLHVMAGFDRALMNGTRRAAES